MWPIKEKENAHIMAKYYPLNQAAGMRRYGSLININPSCWGELNIHSDMAVDCRKSYHLQLPKDCCRLCMQKPA